jgi:hypothetical protein
MFRINLPKKRRESSAKARKHSFIKNSKLKTQNLKIKRIGVIGIGGRTGTMFTFELKNSVEVLGIGRKEEIELIKKRKLFVKRNGNEFLFERETISDSEFLRALPLDALFLTVKNPIRTAVSYYYQKIKEENFTPPALFLSQNGIEVGEEAISVLKEIFGEGAKEIPVFRISLFNPVNKEVENEKISISYSLPIKIAIAQIFGLKINVSQIFKGKNFEVFFVEQKNAKNMEYSKLFLNLIGIPSATYGFSIKDGFLRKEIFKEEILALREYKRVVKLSGGKFLNFPGYPVKFLSFLISLPISFLIPFREILARKIEKERAEKKKDLDEIDYYNGAVFKMAKKLKVEVPINSKILERVKK